MPDGLVNCSQQGAAAESSGSTSQQAGRCLPCKVERQLRSPQFHRCSPDALLLRSNVKTDETYAHEWNRSYNLMRRRARAASLSVSSSPHGRIKTPVAAQIDYLAVSSILMHICSNNLVAMYLSNDLVAGIALCSVHDRPCRSKEPLWRRPLWLAQPTAEGRYMHVTTCSQHSKS